MRSISIVLAAGAAFCLAGCSSQGGTRTAAAQKPAAPLTGTQRALSRPYIASPQRAMRDMSDTSKSDAAAHASANVPRAGARAPRAATPVGRTPIAQRTLPPSFAPPSFAPPSFAPPTSAGMPPSAATRSVCPPVCDPCVPVYKAAPTGCDENLCPGGNCGVPGPACFDPCSLCPGGNCAVPAPAFCCPR